MPLLTYEEFINRVQGRPDAAANQIVQEFLNRYARHHFNESGHFKQSYWASVLFFHLHPEAKDTVRNFPENEPVDFQANEELLEGWRYFLYSHRGDRSDALEFDVEVLYRGLHENLGGRLTTGGGAGYPLKIVMRLVADL